jgi:Tol biopolymer transport system component
MSVSVSEGSLREIYSSPAFLGRPVWLSSGDSILIPHYDDAYERIQLWTISHPEGTAKRFTNDLTDYDQALDITADGRTIAAIATSAVSNIWIAPAGDEASARQITFGETPMLEAVETSDGRLLATSGGGQLWLMNSDGSGRELLDAQRAGSIRRCGPFMLFASYDRDTVTLIRLNSDGSHPMKLFSGDLRHPGCSPDGRFAYYANGYRPQKIWRISLEGGPPTEFAAGLGDGIPGPFDISPDGTLLAFPYRDESVPEWKIAVLPVSGGTPLKTFKVPGVIRVRWNQTGQGLQYLITKNGVTNLWEQSLVGGPTRQLTQFTSGRIFDFNWSSNCQRLLLTRGEVTNDVVLFSNLH